MKIPVFPLNGAIMFPKTNLPLNIFEERYIEMVDYSLSGDRIIGMVQQKSKNELYDIGCFGKITFFNETADKRYLINLEGISCFKILKEVITKNKFRIFEIEVFEKYNHNISKNSLKAKILDCFKKYNQAKGININIDEVRGLNIVDLMKFIAMISPFDVSVKQMFLEIKSDEDLYERLLSVLEIELASSQHNSSHN